MVSLVRYMIRHHQAIKRLPNYGEVVGTYWGSTEDLGGLQNVRIGNVNIALPPEVEQKLRPLIGKRIGILHTDVPGKEYLIRDLSEEKARKQDALAVNPIVSKSNNVAGEVV
jgi:hypothetical protein